MQKLLVTVSLAISVLVITMLKLPNYAILSSYLLAIAFSTLYGERKFNFLFILLIFPFIASNYIPSYELMVIAIASISSFYYPSISYVLIPLGITLSLFESSSIVDLYVFLGLVVAYNLLKYDSRGIVASGIIFLILSPFVKPVLFGNLAYFNLVFGVISLIMESSQVKIPKRIKVPLTLLLFPLTTFLLPLPSSYYWWNLDSFLFKNFLSLYILGYGYNLRIDEFPLYYASYFLISKFGQSIGLHILIFLLYFASGMSAYLFFEKNKLLLSFIYSVLTPIFLPSLTLAYITLPLSLYLVNKLDIKRFLAFSSLTVISGYAFPFVFTLSSLLLNKRKEYAVFSFLFSLFWLIPYILIGFPNEKFPLPSLEVYILFTVASILAFFSHRKALAILLVISSAYFALDLPYSAILFPIVILLSLLLSQESKVILPILLITLVVFQGFTLAPSLTFNGVPANVQKIVNQLENRSFGLVKWNGSYSLLSPYPITNSSDLAKYIVVQQDKNFTLSNNSVYINQPLPLIVKVNQSLITPPKVLNISDSNVTVKGDRIYWKILSGPQTSEIWISLSALEKFEGYLYFKMNVTDLTYFYVILSSPSGIKEFKNTTIIPINQSIDLIELYYYAEEPMIIELIPYYNQSGKLIPLLQHIIPFSFKEEQTANKILVKLNLSTEVNVSILKGYVYSVNNSKFLNSSTILKPGLYYVIIRSATPSYLGISILASVIFFIISLLYVIFKDWLVRIYGKIKQINKEN
ncbi:hypothetical protein [Sulfurisphaera ohwakuensis]|uniref:Uncharacterized protein n=1 Tax=Sulfurisphaera ohwakuensis TaxID=69656 RepID=A0A650CFM0_SULOH|nr:hypothetical protein [Sulfurisphaera ohwakuensis]MBB5254165.1 hypothetical protein [Sulfurisphaera ohwakuensis]QGR16538.1 hypothetical protein D1869_04495 [Sulfurisphaera ohwakuensis]